MKTAKPAPVMNAPATSAVASADRFGAGVGSLPVRRTPLWFNPSRGLDGKIPPTSRSAVVTSSISGLAKRHGGEIAHSVEATGRTDRGVTSSSSSCACDLRSVSDLGLSGHNGGVESGS